MLSHDAKLRCDLVDLYYTLYGSKRPLCLPIPELGCLKPRKAGPQASPERDENVRPVTIDNSLHDILEKYFSKFKNSAQSRPAG